MVEVRSFTFVGRIVALVLAASHAGALAQVPESCTVDRATGTTIDPQPLLSRAYGVRWNAATDRLAVMQPDAEGYYRVFTARPDGSDMMPLGSVVPGHQGAAYWHPSGRFLLFTAQKREWSGRKLFGVPDYEALPGFGRHDDLWLATGDGSRTWRLTNAPNTIDEGVLIPVFDPTGRRIAWSARQPGGTYALMVASFVETPEPHLDDVRMFQPGGAAYYETGSFASDGTRLFYTSSQDTHSFWRSQIYSLDLATGRSTRLTSDQNYNEHPTAVSTPSGDWIVYMSTRGVDRRPLHLLLGTDWYAMRADGKEAKRLTTMNVNRVDPENAGVMQVAGTVAVSPTGTYMIGDVQDSLVKQTGSARIVRFVCP